MRFHATFGSATGVHRAPLGEWHWTATVRWRWRAAFLKDVLKCLFCAVNPVNGKTQRRRCWKGNYHLYCHCQLYSLPSDRQLTSEKM
ncbi:hypothetical protein BC826DRAFT_992416 [Russula brevipes]|nr:hypothetical protein BC826DRAFT_992416 [Russula brevipes]